MQYLVRRGAVLGPADWGWRGTVEPAELLGATLQKLDGRVCIVVGTHDEWSIHHLLPLIARLADDNTGAREWHTPPAD